MTTYRYVVEAVIETDRKVTKKLVKEFVQTALDNWNWMAGTVGFTKARVRKVDMD